MNTKIFFEELACSSHGPVTRVAVAGSFIALPTSVFSAEKQCHPEAGEARRGTSPLQFASRRQKWISIWSRDLPGAPACHADALGHASTPTRCPLWCWVTRLAIGRSLVVYAARDDTQFSTRNEDQTKVWERGNLIAQLLELFP
jgi:hypothetical protein